MQRSDIASLIKDETKLKMVISTQMIALKFKGLPYDWRYFSKTNTWESTKLKLTGDQIEKYKSTWISLQEKSSGN